MKTIILHSFKHEAFLFYFPVWQKAINNISFPVVIQVEEHFYKQQIFPTPDSWKSFMPRDKSWVFSDFIYSEFQNSLKYLI